MLKLMHKINKYYKVFNKYMPYNYLASISIVISIVDRIKSTKFTVFLKRIFKILIWINIIFSVSLIVYYTDIITPISTTYSIYNHLIEPYIQIIINLYTELINYYNTIISQFKFFIKDLFQAEAVNQSNSVLQESIHRGCAGIKDEVKEGIKSGIKEVIQDLKDDLAASESDQSDLFKQIVIFTTVLFGIYFIFILPNNTEVIQDYNWINAGLINIKLSIIDIFYFSKPANPPSAPINPLTQYIDACTQTINPLIDASIETNIKGLAVSKMVETVNILQDVLGEEQSDLIKDGVNKIVTNITD